MEKVIREMIIRDCKKCSAIVKYEQCGNRMGMIRCGQCHERTLIISDDLEEKTIKEWNQMQR